MGTLQLGERCKHGLYCECFICNFEKKIERLSQKNQGRDLKMNIRQELTWFSEQMETNLKANDHKGGWKDCTMEYLVRRLQEEVEELKCAVANEADPTIIAKEAADVANFAMMIADVKKGL